MWQEIVKTLHQDQMVLRSTKVPVRGHTSEISTGMGRPFKLSGMSMSKRVAKALSDRLVWQDPHMAFPQQCRVQSGMAGDENRPMIPAIGLTELVT